MKAGGTTDWDATIIGGGVVGLACAARIARAKMNVLVLDRHAKVGQETSSRNSGVVHAGIYYPNGSLTAELCVRGRELLYERCRRNRIAHRKLGKLIVASTEAEIPRLEQMRNNAAGNGVDRA